MSSIYSWSTTAADNATADSAINFAEGQAPSTLNNSSRQVMARIAEILDDLGGALVAGGTANAITITANSAFSAYADGITLAFRATADNTAATTLNVNSIGAKSIRKFNTTGEAALAGTELQEDGIYVVRYSTDLNSNAGGWHLLNPSLDAANYVTLTGTQTLTNKTLTSPTINGGTFTGGTDIAVADGGTGASDASGARTNLGLAIGTNVQAYDATLTSLAAISGVAGDVIYASGTDTWARLPKGTDGYIIKQASGLPSWAALDFGAGNAALTVGGIGTYAFLRYTSGTTADFSPGDTTAGSNLSYATASGYYVTNDHPSGTWMCMGRVKYTGESQAGQTTLWLRIS